MKKPAIFAIATLYFFGVFIPGAALAHQNSLLQIGNDFYWFKIGFIRGGEETPLARERTEFQIYVLRADSKSISADPRSAELVPDIEKNLSAEVIFGNVKKEFKLTSIERTNQPTFYTLSFVPGVEGVYSLRLFGTLDNIPVDMTFTCSSAGHGVVSEQNRLQIKIGAKELKRSGSFACPISRDQILFPGAVSSGQNAGSASQPLSLRERLAPYETQLEVGVVVSGFLAILLSAAAIFRSRRVGGVTYTLKKP